MGTQYPTFIEQFPVSQVIRQILEISALENQNADQEYPLSNEAYTSDDFLKKMTDFASRGQPEAEIENQEDELLLSDTNQPDNAEVMLHQ